MFSQQLNVFFLLLLIAWVVGRTTSPDLDEDCELNAVDTMHDFCCDLHDESPQFSDCQMEWHEKIPYETDEEEQIYMFCTAECSFNNTEFVGKDRRSLNLIQVKEHLESDLVNDADVALLYDTYIKCDKHALSLMPHKGVKQLARRLSHHGCHPYPGLVLECVANEMILHCPAKRFHQTAQCEETRNHLKQCMQYLKYKS
ncbi:general odorant-binding protein 68 isoform X2 [Drosophila elegans]|uniref:general odorant-binding protein 68 isoform X2 n=1 Tax=Drosophila elegans TaxID=30023 RepID=UPI001BC854EF|nr:general odorant-binding protein 68 isoform X2 [Drosophila elegans]